MINELDWSDPGVAVLQLQSLFRFTNMERFSSLVKRFGDHELAWHGQVHHNNSMLGRSRHGPTIALRTVGNPAVICALRPRRVDSQCGSGRFDQGPTATDFLSASRSDMQDFEVYSQRLSCQWVVAIE